MAKMCPLKNGPALYTECLECEEKSCRETRQLKFSVQKRDLFSMPAGWWYCQCISADFAMGKGIAVQFNKKYDVKNVLKKAHGDRIQAWDLSGNPDHGECIVCEPVMNLVTKRNYWDKPGLANLRNALMAMRTACSDLMVKRLAMPKIGCGLDRLDWPDVEKLILEIFGDMDMEIVVCSL